jgi:glycosyltransferase involved in cell wall biosynthesis
MKILLIHQYFLEKEDPGGSRFNEMTKVWTEAGHEVVVLAGMVNYLTGKVPAKYKGKRFLKEAYEPNLWVQRCYVSPQYNVNFAGRLWAYFSFVFSSTWAGLFLLKTKPDIIVVTSPPLFVGISAYVISRIRSIPYIFEVRDLWPESAIDSGVLTQKSIIRLALWLESFLYRKANKINVLTPAFRNNLIQKKGVPAEKVVFVPNAADFTLSDPLLEKFDAVAFKQQLGFSEKFVATYVGAHGVANHLIQLLDAAELLRDEPIVIQLIGDGMQKAMLIEEAKKRNLENVVFVASVPKAEVFKYILASDVGLSVLKKVETFKTIYSNKTFDYMACQRPIVLCIDGVSRELVEEADCGRYAEPENPRAIADALLYYANHPDEVKRQGINGFNHAKQHFDRQHLALQYLGVMESVHGK